MQSYAKRKGGDSVDNVEEDEDGDGEFSSCTHGEAYAKRRVNSVRSKLAGVNPCVIVRNDLGESMVRDSPHFAAFVNTACGANINEPDTGGAAPSSKWPLRAKLLKEHGEAYKLSVDEQVKCIVEMATDEAILGRTWTGWQPFI